MRFQFVLEQLRCLTKYLSSYVFEHFADASSYDEAIKTLDQLYFRPRNEMFFRIHLALRPKEVKNQLKLLIKSLKNCTMTLKM